MGAHFYNEFTVNYVCSDGASRPSKLIFKTVKQLLQHSEATDTMFLDYYQRPMRKIFFVFKPVKRLLLYYYWYELGCNKILEFKTVKHLLLYFEAVSAMFLASCICSICIIRVFHYTPW